MKSKNFCTCDDLKCPLHPSNHEKGCDLCIQKCLRKKEIPSCFFIDINSDIKGIDDFTYEGFAKFLEENNTK
ncbi:MAG: DUF6485 family protein [Eubacteriales bacterium]